MGQKNDSHSTIKERKQRNKDGLRGDMRQAGEGLKEAAYSSHAVKGHLGLDATVMWSSQTWWGPAAP